MANLKCEQGREGRDEECLVGYCIGPSRSLLKHQGGPGSYVEGYLCEASRIYGGCAQLRIVRMELSDDLLIGNCEPWGRRDKGKKKEEDTVEDRQGSSDPGSQMRL